MRKIKFRGYAVPEMVGSQWLYGFGVDCVEFAEHYAKEIGRKEDWYLYTDSGPIQVSKESVGQYTGLKDKNDREIYEGDITECFAFGLTTVEFRSGSFGLYSKHQGFFPFNDIHGRVKVVGNVWENGGLLDDRQDTESN